MAPRKGTTVVVGIDFGTTFSGVSWACGELGPQVITDWPTSRASNADQEKVPSAITYDENGKVENWGYEAIESGLAECTFRWFKIMLETTGSRPGNPEEQQDIEDIRQSIRALLERTNKTPEDVTADFLGALWEYTRVYIGKRVENTSWEKTSVVVLTVPAVWSDGAKSKTLDSARKAGLGDCTILSEPEAAALSTLKDRSEGQVLEVGDAFVVCDAGGGTVDLITYCVKNLEPFEIEECAPGDGGLCGSVALDRGFERYIRTKIGEVQYRSMNVRARRELLQDFDQAVKRSFEWASTKSYGIRVIGVQDNADEGIEDEYLKLGSPVLATIFDNVCQKIDRLVERQVNMGREKAGKVKAILLVGGFGDSKYLHGRLEAKFSPNIRIQRANRAWSAISRGATFCGQALACKQPSPVKTKIARGSYGFLRMERFDKTKHQEKDRKFNELTGTYMAQSIRWVIKRNDKIVHDGPPGQYDVHLRFENLSRWPHMKQELKTCLYYCPEDEPPLSMDDSVQKICNVTYTFSESKARASATKVKPEGDGHEHYKCDLVYQIRANLSTIEFSVLFNGKDVGSVRTEYI